MAATLGGALQVPFTAAVFAMETTHAWSLFLPVMVATTTATGVSVLWLPRSILTEKVARRGAHIRREYGVHPLESLAVDDTMVPWNQVAGLSVFQQVLAARTNILKGEISSHRAYPLLDVNGSPIGLVRRRRLFDDADPFAPLTALAEDLPIILVQSRVRAAADQMASHHLPALLVVDHEGLPAGWITGDAIEQALCREIEQDTRRERVWHFRRPHA
jgi:CBS domain-containing protein